MSSSNSNDDSAAVDVFRQSLGSATRAIAREEEAAALYTDLAEWWSSI